MRLTSAMPPLQRIEYGGTSRRKTSVGGAAFPESANLKPVLVSLVLQVISVESFCCPKCNCEFHHNRKKWLVGIPSGLAMAFVLLYFTQRYVPPIFTAFLAVGIVVWTMSRIPSYIIAQRGGSQKIMPNKLPLPTPAVVTPVSKAPVAPPPGAAGR